MYMRCKFSNVWWELFRDRTHKQGKASDRLDITYLLHEMLWSSGEYIYRRSMTNVFINNSTTPCEH